MTTFDDILGQSRAIDFLRGAYSADRLAHALIFSGPRGVGKGTTALALAGVFLCEKPRGTSPCGACESCRLLPGGSHPDYHVITKELIRYHDKTGESKGIELSIHVMRPELIQPANHKAVMGRGKVFVIEQAELMNGAAQNSILKTLEEPAGRTIIVLLTDAPEGLLPTVRSRCQLVRFAALDRAIVTAQLEKRGIERAVAGSAAEMAEGSLGGALRLIEDGVIEPARNLIAQMDALLSGRAPVDLQDWFKKAADAYAEKQLERDPLSSKPAATRAGLTLYLALAAGRFRRRLSEGGDPDEMERACRAIDAIVRAEMYIDANVNVAVIFQQLAMTLEAEFAVSLSERV